MIFIANKAGMRCVEKETLTSGMLHAVTCMFNFSPDWDGLGKTAVFECGNVVKDQAVLNNRADIPWECLVAANVGKHLRVGVYGINGDGDVIIPTVYCNAGDVVERGADPAGDPSIDPSPTVYQEVLADNAATRQKADEAIAAGSAAVAAKEAAETAQGKAETAQEKAEQAQSNAEAEALKSEGRASGTQNGEPVESGSPYYHNNASYFSEQASEKAGEAAQSAGTASDKSLVAEGYALGKQNGTDVPSTSPYYHNNAKYHAEQAAGSQTAAAGSATSANTEALKAEGQAVGKQNGQDVGSSSPYYHNNAKYFYEQAASVNKADKVIGATAGHVAALDASGNLVDNGNKYHPDNRDDTMHLRVGVDAAGRLWASGDSGSERFGVQGVGNAATTLTRLWDAQGLTATPGTDETDAVSDFDQFPVFNRKKCVGSWSVVNGKAVFTVAAYEGDADYAEDGSMGDYVAVDIPPTYWFHDEENKILGVSGGTHPGWEPHPICVDANGEVREHTYLPVYSLAKDGNGHAVSLPGYDPFFGNFKTVWDAARTYGDGSSLANYAILEPSVVDHYEWLMMTIEFATMNMQTVMNGAVSMAYNTNHTITLAPAANKLVLTGSIGDNFVVGQTIYIGADHGSTPSDVSAYNHITAIEKCDADGTLNTDGTYRLVTYDGTDRTSSITANTTKVSSRPWITGATAGFASDVAAVKGHTGSPVSNSSGKYPFRYRWRENVYGNINITALDLFNARTVDGDSYHLDWYYNDRLRYEGPTLYYPSNTSKPDLTDLQTAANGFRKLTTTTPVSGYKDGYILTEGFDEDLPCIRVPTATGTPASATAYYCDYAFLVYSSAVRAVRRRGYLSSGAHAGPRFVNAIYAPSAGHWYFGATLFITQ